MLSTQSHGATEVLNEFLMQYEWWQEFFYNFQEGDCVKIGDFSEAKLVPNMEINL
jgi:hypothetical protein